jgi:hypothetical protein
MRVVGFFGLIELVAFIELKNRFAYRICPLDQSTVCLQFFNSINPINPINPTNSISLDPDPQNA